MSDNEDAIKGAFQRGLLAAKQAETSRVELNAAITDFGYRINEASEGAITIAFEDTFVEKVRMISQFLSSKLGELAPEMIKTKGIFAYARYRTSEGKLTSGNRMQLCIVTISKDIFPVQLDWENETLICHNASDVLQGLEVLAADSRIGTKFLSVMAEYNAIMSTTSKKLPPANE